MRTRVGIDEAWGGYAGADMMAISLGLGGQFPAYSLGHGAHKAPTDFDANRAVWFPPHAEAFQSERAPPGSDRPADGARALPLSAEEPRQMGGW